MMYVALTYDHRLIDGREAVTFLVKVKEAIEDPARNQRMAVSRVFGKVFSSKRFISEFFVLSCKCAIFFPDKVSKMFCTL